MLRVHYYCEFRFFRVQGLGLLRQPNRGSKPVVPGKDKVSKRDSRNSTYNQRNPREWR
jgi:hypothetical protein